MVGVSLMDGVGQGFPGQGPGQLAPGLELQTRGILWPWPVF